MKRIVVLSLSFVVLAWLAGAADLSDKPEKWDINYHYDPGDRRDPFVPYVKKIFVVPQGEMAVEQAVLVGITRDSRGFVALLEGVDGKAQPFREGARLFDGEILRIEADRVVFIQILPADEILIQKEVIKMLHPESGSQKAVDWQQ